MIKREDRNLGPRAYKVQHTQKLIAEINKIFPVYFSSFSKPGNHVQSLLENSNFRVVPSKSDNTSKTLNHTFQKSIDYLLDNQPNYQIFFDLERLDEDRDDPNAFKTNLSKRVSIISRCLNSKAKEMERYQVEFHRKPGREMLDVTIAIMTFGKDYHDSFSNSGHEAAITIDELGLGALLEEKYTSYNVIGGGIKSNFLHTLYPNMFSYRSQNALWAMWYLTSKKDFSFTDGSEFLMIDTKKNTVQQNYHYPYDLFSFYALHIYKLLKQACKTHGVPLDDSYRYIYLDSFLNHIAEKEGKEIEELKKTGDYAG